MKQTLTAKDLDNSRKRYLSNLKKLDAKLALYDELVEELRNIANAKPSGWGEQRDQFLPWAQNRARNILAKADAIERRDA